MIRALHDRLGVEELANTLTHGLGLVLSIAGFVTLFILAYEKASPERLVGCTIYGLSLVSLYAASTFYHSATKPSLKSRLKIADYCCIYLLIAGTYTPFTLSSLDKLHGLGLLAAVWTLSLMGIAGKIFFGDKFPRLRVASYVFLGWLGIVAIVPLYNSLGWIPLALLLGGGLSYSIGVIFFAWQNLRHHHAIFHIFVLIGSILHFAAVAGYAI
ncbi:MAG: PAQR family membrane homeostasis protein TrhA [Pyrinomonadaceae bacterium]|jgi:hemolysin III